MSETMTIESGSVEETIRIGRAIGGALVGGEVIALVGELGAGKTHLVKGIAAGLGVADERAVNSPTFVLVNEYEGRMPVFHLDAYRLAGARQLAALGFEEMCESGGVVIVEWADRVREVMPSNAVWVIMYTVGENSRQLRIENETMGIRDAVLQLALLCHKKKSMDMELERAHAHCCAHREQIMRSKSCGCFYCLAIFQPHEIEDWITEETMGGRQTALCPHCGIDSVLGDASGLTLDATFLNRMKQAWF